MAKTNKQRDFDVDKTYKFELTKPHLGNYILPKEAIVYDEDSKTLREIRLSATATSPYKDEQDESDEVSSDILQFIKGRLSVSGIEAYKLRYLLALDNNEEKKKRNPKFKGSFNFKLIDEEQLFKDKADATKLQLKVLTALSEASKEDLTNFLKAEYNFTPITDTIEEVFEQASAFARRDAQYVLDNFNTEANKLKVTLINAFKEGTLKNTKGVVTWGDTGTEVKAFKLDDGAKLTDLMVEWIGKGTKEANDFVKKLTLSK